MKHPLASLVAVVLLCASGCSLPKIASPVGQMLEDNAVLGLSGVWISSTNDIVSATYHDGALYIPNQAFNTKSCEFEVKTLKAVPRLIGKSTLLFVKAKNEPDPFIFFLLVHNSNGTIAVRRPSSDFFRDAIASGKLTKAPNAGDELEILDDAEIFVAFMSTIDLEKAFPAKFAIELSRVEMKSKEQSCGKIKESVD